MSNGRGLGARDPRRPENQDGIRRQERAYALFIAGMTFEQIAASPDKERGGAPLYEGGRGSAYTAVQAAIKRHSGFETVEEMRRVEGLRLDALQRAHWAKALNGSGWDTDRIMQIMQHRARIFGLNAPVRSQVEVLTTDTVQAAIDELTRQIAEEDAIAAALNAPVDGLTADGDPVEMSGS